MSKEIISVDAEEVPIEKAVETSFLSSLEKHEINKKMLEEKRDHCLSLKLNGQDKETYTLIRETRLNMKTNRVAIEKICKKGREDATKTQKAWIAVEKDYVKIVSEGEDYLSGLEEEFENEQERIKQEAKRKQEEAFIIRQADLTRMGASYMDGSFILNDVSYEAILIKESDDDVWESMKAKFNEQHLINEEKKLEEEKQKAEAAALLDQQRIDQERRQKELEEREANIKKAEEAAAQLEQDRIAREKAEEDQRIQALWRGRLAQIDEVGWNGQFAFPKLGDHETKIFTYDELVHLPDDVFNKRLKEANDATSNHKKEIEEKRLAEIEEQKRIAAEAAVKKEQERVAEEARKSEEKRLQEARQQQEDALKASDKTKWQTILSSLKEISFPEMKHPAYKQKVADAKKLISKIVDL